MINLNKMEVFRECGFGDASLNYGTSHMPHIQFNGYDKVMDYCYTAGRKDINRIHVTQDEGGIKNLLDTWELVKKIKDLETANARLLERNHELQVDNEQSLKEVENQYKVVAALRNENMNALSSIKDVSGYVEELQQENLEYSKRCDELRKYNMELARGSLKQDIESVPKSKFVITVEEF